MALAAPLPSRPSRFHLLKAAIQIFAKKGFKGTTIREVAKAAEINSSLISYHFGGKAGLYKAALQLACRMIRRLPSRLPAPPGPREADARKRAILALDAYIRQFLHQILRLWATSPEGVPLDFERAIFTLVLRELAAPDATSWAILKASIQPHLDYVHGCLQVLQPSLDPETTFRMTTTVHSQLLFFFSYHQASTLIRGCPYHTDDAFSLADHVAHMVLSHLDQPPIRSQP